MGPYVSPRYRTQYIPVAMTIDSAVNDRAYQLIAPCAIILVEIVHVPQRPLSAYLCVHSAAKRPTFGVETAHGA